MKRYLVKHHNKATEKNTNFPGQQAIAYYGKDQKLLAYLGDHATAVHEEQYTNKWFIKEYGYKRECDAKRSWIYKNPEFSENWHATVDIVTVEV